MKSAGGYRIASKLIEKERAGSGSIENLHRNMSRT